MAVRRTAACELLGRGEEGCWKGTENCNTQWGWDNTQLLREQVMLEVCVYILCFPVWVQIFCVHLAFVVGETVPEQRQNVCCARIIP